MIVTFHRFNPEQELPRQRLELYRGICKLQLDDRPRARGIPMLLSFANSQAVLQAIALAMTQANRATIQRQPLLNFLAKHPIWQREGVDPADWLKQMLDVSELLVEREPREYEFPHLSFQGFFAATQLAQAQNQSQIETNARLVLKNWTGAVWRETVLLYTAQLPPQILDPLIRAACKQGSEAAELAAICVKEYPRPQRLSADVTALLDTLVNVAQVSKYQRLEELLKAQQWKEADQETYRLMITAVGKDEGQWFTSDELLNFPCDDLRAIDGLWVKYSKELFGFSVQKEIYRQIPGVKLDGKYPGKKAWEQFGDTVGWRKNGEWLSYDELEPSFSSPAGNFPSLCGRGWMDGNGVFEVSLLLHRDL